jgi:hypothetical protein
MFASSSPRRYRSFFLLALVLFPWLTAAQCLSNATIPFPIKKDFTFTVDIDKAAGDALSKQGVQQTPDGKIPDGAPDVPVPVEFEQVVDIRDDSNVKKYGNKLSYVEINSVLVTTTENSVNVPLPSLVVRMSNLDKSNEQEVGSLRSINAGEVGVIGDMVDASKRDLAGKYILQFAFNTKALAQMTLKAGMPVPKGKVTLKLTVDVKLGLSPFK